MHHPQHPCPQRIPTGAPSDLTEGYTCVTSQFCIARDTRPLRRRVGPVRTPLWVIRTPLVVCRDLVSPTSQGCASGDPREAWLLPTPSLLKVEKESRPPFIPFANRPSGRQPIPPAPADMRADGPHPRGYAGGRASHPPPTVNGNFKGSGLPLLPLTNNEGCNRRLELQSRSKGTSTAGQVQTRMWVLLIAYFWKPLRCAKWHLAFF
jgi:hypothetical protein